MKSATDKYVSSDVISGANSVIVADFNGDGKQDIFLPAHNESPFLAMPSTLYTANAAGGFDKTVLADKVMAHDAELSLASTVPTVFTATFGPGDANPVYAFSGGALQETIPTNLAGLPPEHRGRRLRRQRRGGGGHGRRLQQRPGR
jgi:hypothetical protein